MKISTLIEELSALQEKHGDLSVTLIDVEGCYTEVDRIGLQYPRDRQTQREDKTRNPHSVILYW